MSYEYQETSDELVVSKGIATREMLLHYEDGDEYATYGALATAVEFRDRVPIVLDSTHDHRQPLSNTQSAIGYVELRPCPEKKGVAATYHFKKARTPDWILTKIRAREPLPESMFKYRTLRDGYQENILFDHVAILSTSTPRCPLPRCGVGVYDSQEGPSTMSEKVSEKPKSESTPEGLVIGRAHVGPAVSEPVSPIPPKGEKPTEPKASLTPLLSAEATPHALPVEEAQTLRTQLKETQAQLDAIRRPLVEELSQRGIPVKDLNAVPLDTLEKIRDLARQATTQGLPGAVPRPVPERPKSLAERREEATAKMRKEAAEAQEKRWHGM
jgi:hypothetical protein